MARNRILSNKIIKTGRITVIHPHDRWYNEPGLVGKACVIEVFKDEAENEYLSGWAIVETYETELFFYRVQIDETCVVETITSQEN